MENTLAATLSNAPQNMNIAKLRQALNSRVRLRPSACSIDQHGREALFDDIWLLSSVSQVGVVELQNIHTGHVAKLGPDHIHHYDSDPLSSELGLSDGFLNITVQLFQSGQSLWLEPIQHPSGGAKHSTIAKKVLK